VGAIDTEPWTLAPWPHRAYRRLPVFRPTTVAVSVLVVVAIETALVLTLGPLVRIFGEATLRIAQMVGTMAWLGRDRFLGVDLFPLLFSEIPPLSPQAALLWLAGGAGALALVSRSEWVIPPVRFLLAFNLALLSASALYLVFAGRLGYDAAEFSNLYLRTVVVVWLVTPLFIAGLSLTLPFSALERAALMVLTLAYDVVFCAVRYALFAWLLTEVGAVVMANLYLFLGPLLDFVYLVGIFALFLPRLGRRLGREMAFES
jgi:hypothetical protein